MPIMNAKGIARKSNYQHSEYGITPKLPASIFAPRARISERGPWFASRYAHEPFSSSVCWPQISLRSRNQSMQPGSERKRWNPLGRPSFIVPGECNFCKTIDNKCVASHWPHTFKMPQTGINVGFGIRDSGFMSISKIGHRFGLFEWRQAAQLNSPANHVCHAAFQPSQQVFRRDGPSPRVVILSSS